MVSPEPEAEQQQPRPHRTMSSPPEMLSQAGSGQQGGSAWQTPAGQQSRTVSGSFSSLSVERQQASSGSGGLADAVGMHHHHLQVLQLLLALLS